MQAQPVDHLAHHRFRLLGSQITLLDGNQILDFVRATIETDEHATILSGNVYAYNLAYTTPWLQQFLNQADVVRLDGAGVRLGLRLLGKSSPKRNTWADFAWDLAGFAEIHGYQLYFLGGKPGIAEEAAHQMRLAHPSLQVAGVHHGYFDKTAGSSENRQIIESINDLSPHILIVGFGMPMQEKWLWENRPHLNANVVFTGGAVFDYVSGNLKRAPKWMTDFGLEWLGRMLIEPRRLWKRYILGNPLFLWRVTRQLLKGPPRLNTQNDAR